MKEKQTALIEKNLKGFIPDALLASQLKLIEEEISEIESALVIQENETVDVQEALAFCKKYLEAPSSVWEEADVSTKIKLQKFQFPSGITFDGEKFGTSEVSLVFKAKEAFLPPYSTRVDPTGFEPVTSSLQMRRSTN